MPKARRQDAHRDGGKVANVGALDGEAEGVARIGRDGVGDGVVLSGGSGDL
jgi:hypothetical protein